MYYDLFHRFNKLEDFTKDNFIHAMCRFIPEVNRKKGKGPYLGRTFYMLVISIQKYLHVNKIYLKIIDDTEFEDHRPINILDNVMKERTEMNKGLLGVTVMLSHMSMSKSSEIKIYFVQIC